MVDRTSVWTEIELIFWLLKFGIYILVTFFKRLLFCLSLKYWLVILLKMSFIWDETIRESDDEENEEEYEMTEDPRRARNQSKGKFGWGQAKKQTQPSKNTCSKIPECNQAWVLFLEFFKWEKLFKTKIMRIFIVTQIETLMSEAL